MSSRFAATWLEQRERADHAARARALLPALADWLPERPLTIADLGAGSGSNLRYLGPRLAPAQHWVLIDQDSGLLDTAASPAPRITLAPRAGDLAAAALPADLAPDLVTASALLDLVSEPWLEALASRCRERRSAVLLALSVDGEIGAEPADAADPAVFALVQAHQRRDKGFGPALGGVAARTAETVFRAAGYRTWLSPSPWRLGPDAGALQASLVDGWAQAAREQAGPDAGAWLDDWHRRRYSAIRSGAGRLRVGHQDLLALPPGDAGG